MAITRNYGYPSLSLDFMTKIQNSEFFFNLLFIMNIFMLDAFSPLFHLSIGIHAFSGIVEYYL